MPILIKTTKPSNIPEIYFNCCTMPMPSLTAFRQAYPEDNNYFTGKLYCRTCGEKLLAIEIDW